MRISIVNQYYLPDISPTAQLAGSLAEHRAAKGDRVTALCGTGSYVQVAGHAGKAVSPAGVNVAYVGTPSLGKKRLLFRLIDYLSFYLLAAVRVATLPRQDVIITLTTPAYIVLAGLLHKMLHPGTKVVHWVMDCYPEVLEMAGLLRKGSFLSRVMRRLNHFIFSRVDHLVCLDRAMLELLTGQYAAGSDRPPACIIPNWECETLFPKNQWTPAWDGASRVGLSGRFVVLYLGNAGSGHQFDAVLHAAEQLQAEPVTFLFIGGGSRWKEIEQAKHDRKLDNVVLLGYVPKEQTRAVMAACHAALITLRDQAVGLISPSKLHASLAMGLPVVYVGPEDSNVDEAIAISGCGVSLRTGDAAGLVAFVRRLRSDSTYYDELRGRARAAFEANYCDRVTLPQFDRILDALDSGRRRRNGKP